MLAGASWVTVRRVVAEHRMQAGLHVWGGATWAAGASYAGAALYAEETRMLTGHHMQTGHRSLKYCMRAGFDRYRDIVC